MQNEKEEKLTSFRMASSKLSKGRERQGGHTSIQMASSPSYDLPGCPMIYT